MSHCVDLYFQASNFNCCMICVNFLLRRSIAKHPDISFEPEFFLLVVKFSLYK